jgi:two-component system invasion response regulator UvrY
MNEDYTVVLVDDHVLLRNGLATTVTNFGYEVLYECKNGKDLQERIKKDNQPDVVLLDINMPEMDGFDTALWLKNNFPLVNVLALSMYDDDNSIIRMIRNGAKGYILKDSSPQELKQAIVSVMTKGFYYTDHVTGRVIKKIGDETPNNTMNKVMGLSQKEIEFLKLAGTELTYKEIAGQMHLSPRTIDGYRDQLFEKLNIKSRVGLVMFAIRNGVIQLT